MHIRCDKDEFHSALSIVGRVLSVRTTMPILEGVYLSARDGSLRLVATDLQKGVEVTMPAQVLQEGEAVLPGRLLLDIARRLPQGQVDLIKEDTRATLSCAHSKTVLQSMDAGEYPALPQVQSARPVVMEAGVFKDMIRQTVFAAAVDESRPILTGALFEMDGGVTRMVALDGYRLALRETPASEDQGQLSAVVPAASLTEIGRILGGEEEVRLSMSDAHFMVDTGTVRLVTRLLEGDFIRYRQILPADWQTRVRVSTRDLEQAVERAATLAREGKNNLIRFTVGDGTLHIESNSEAGSVDEDLTVYLEGKPMEIAFNARYMSDVLKAIDEDDCYLCFTTNVSPCVLRPVEGDHFLYLVLPVRVFAQ